MLFRKKILGQLEVGMKILILTVLIYPGEICKRYTPKNPTCCEPMDESLQSSQALKVWKN